MKKLEPNSLIKKIFVVIILFSIFFMLWGQITVRENDDEHHQFEELECEWERIMPDGGRMPVTVPGITEAERKEQVIIETVLPEKIPSNYSICVRSSQQDMEILVGGKLIKRYSTESYRPFGKNSMSRYVFAPLTEKDAGNTLQIRTVTDSKYTGKMNPVYLGREIAIQFHLVRSFMLENLLAVSMLVLSIITIVTSAILQTVYHRKIPLQYLGWGIFLVSFWIISESKIRQFFVPNNSIIALMAYVCVILIPIPFAIYVDEMQSLRYHKFYTVLNASCLSVFVLNTVLQLTNVLDYLDTLWLANLLIGIGIVFVIVTIMIDYLKKRIREYRSLIFSFLVLLIAGILENIFALCNGYARYGICICLGIVFTVSMATTFTVRQLRSKENERRSALSVNQSKSEFLIDTSKKIRVPINTIIRTNELILNKERDPEIREYLEGIKRTSYQIQNMIDDIFDYSLIEMNKLNLIEDSYRVQTLVDNISDEAKMKCAGKTLKFEVYVDSRIPEILFGDAVRIQQCVLKLLHHVINNTKEGIIQLDVSGKVTDEKNAEYHLIIRLEDTGIGLSETEIGTLYKSFSDHKKRENGDELELGLGLSKSLTEFMGGNFIIQSIYGQGTSFIMEIPQKMSGDYNALWMIQNERENRESSQVVDVCIDREKLMSYCGDDQDTFYHVLEIFCKKAEDYREQLEAIQENQERKEYLYVLHSLKGSAMTIAAEGLCTLIYEQEKLVQSADTKLLFEKFPAFYDSFLQVVEEAHSILENREKPEKG